MIAHQRIQSNETGANTWPFPLNYVAATVNKVYKLAETIFCGLLHAANSTLVFLHLRRATQQPPAVVQQATTQQTQRAAGCFPLTGQQIQEAAQQRQREQQVDRAFEIFYTALKNSSDTLSLKGIGLTLEELKEVLAAFRGVVFENVKVLDLSENALTNIFPGGMKRMFPNVTTLYRHTNDGFEIGSMSFFRHPDLFPKLTALG